MKNHYIILDAAILGGDIEDAKIYNANHKCLFFGDTGLKFESVAPYLFEFGGNKRFYKHVVSNKLKDKFGIIIETKMNFEETTKHCRKFLKVKTEEGKQLFFRYYDPRVLYPFLTTCDQMQLKALFEGIDSYQFYDVNKLLYKVTFNSGKLQMQKSENENFLLAKSNVEYS